MSVRPDWASVYEALHPSANAADIDRLLDKHAAYFATRGVDFTTCQTLSSMSISTRT